MFVHASYIVLSHWRWYPDGLHVRPKRAPIRPPATEHGQRDAPSMIQTSRVSPRSQETISPGPRHLSFSSSLSIPCAEPPRVSPTRWAPLTPGSWRSLHEAQKGMVADQPGESRGNITIRKRALFEIVPAWGKDARQLFAAIAIQMNGQVRT